MLVFDTATVAPRERADAVSTAMLDATLSTNLVHHEPSDVWLRLGAVPLGSVELTHVRSSGMDTTRTPRQAAGHDDPVVAFSLGMQRGSMIEQDGTEVRTSPRMLNVVELTRPYRSRIQRGTDGWSVKIPLADLAVPASSIAAARTRLTASPVHPVFLQHLDALGRQAAQLEPGPPAALLGTATVALARALLTSAVPDSPHAAEALADTLLVRVQAYVRAHLGDPRLSPERIAAAHHVSVRHLYATFAHADLSLEQWLIGLRLESARRDLVRPESRQRTIAAVGRRWGFVNASHFTRRFREAYGVTPREWQRNRP